MAKKREVTADDRRATQERQRGERLLARITDVYIVTTTSKLRPAPAGPSILKW